MIIRQSKKEDLQNMMTLFHQAQAYFQSQGIDQWQDGYPNEEQILDDIALNQSYVLIHDHQIVGTMFFSTDNDPTYDYIEGEWITSNTQYAVIHRIVVDEKMKGQGLANQLLEFAIEKCHELHIPSIRIDTHDDNLSMQSFLKKNDFQVCGHIYLQSGALRIAFEKILK